MQIGAIGYPTFVYNTNYVSAKSLGKVSAVPDDALDSKVGYADSSRNENPLRLGETKDIAGILDSQMVMSRMNAARIMQTPVQSETEVSGAETDPAMEMIQG